MGYLVCDSCGGYYELAAGESADDFDTCQCGGNLNLQDEVPQSNDSLDEDHDSNSLENNKNVMICPHCFKHHDSGIFCSRCGSDLISVEKGNGFLNRNNLNQQEFAPTKNGRLPKRIPKRIPRNPQNIQHTPDNTESHNLDLDQEYFYYDDSNALKKIINRINWVGIILGSVFFIITSFVLVFSIIFWAISQGDSSSYMSYYQDSQLIFMGILLLIGLILIALISGAIAGYMVKRRIYSDGALNGFVVGLASIALMVGSGEGLASLIALVLFSILAAGGGIIGVFIRKTLND